MQIIRVSTPKNGYSYNPALKFRNQPCLCGSGRKSKKCCGKFQYIKSNIAKYFNARVEWIYDLTGEVEEPNWSDYEHIDKR